MIRVPDPVWGEIWKRSQKQDRQMSKYGHVKMMNVSSWFVGHIVEWIFGRQYGYLEQFWTRLMEVEDRTSDGGIDFFTAAGDMAVKGSSHPNPQWLWHDEKWPPLKTQYVCMGRMDHETRSGELLGYTTSEALMRAPTMPTPKKPICHAILISDLLPMSLFEKLLEMKRQWLKELDGS